jgi:ELWxxDGT repeat protein
VLQFIGPWIPAAGTLFIAGRTAAEGEELWRLNAAGDALVRVVDLAPGTAATSLRGGIERNGTLLFAAAQQGRGIELFVSDGSAPGTAPLLDLARGLQSAPWVVLALSLGEDEDVSARQVELIARRLGGEPARLVADIRPQLATLHPMHVLPLAQIASRRIFAEGTSRREMAGMAMIVGGVALLLMTAL